MTVQAASSIEDLQRQVEALMRERRALGGAARD